MVKIRVMIPNTSISVNTIQHHLPSSGRQKEIIMRSRKKDATATVYGVLRVSCDTVNIISHLSEYVNRGKAESKKSIPLFLLYFFNRNHPISRVGLGGESVGSVGDSHGEGISVFARDAVEPLYLVLAVCH